MDVMGLRVTKRTLENVGDTLVTQDDEIIEKPKTTINIQHFCPVCKQYVNDYKFKNHILHHWITSKKNEEYCEFIRRIYKCTIQIDIVLLDDWF